MLRPYTFHFPPQSERACHPERRRREGSAFPQAQTIGCGARRRREGPAFPQIRRTCVRARSRRHPPVASPPHPPFPAARSPSGLSLAASPPKRRSPTHVPALAQADGGVGGGGGGGAPPARRSVWGQHRSGGAP